MPTIALSEMGSSKSTMPYSAVNAGIKKITASAEVGPAFLISRK
jgi:hypothetical protein